ncbi:Chemotaxis protein methyltransferase [uncultured Pleomorphomonas sp.]|uniref:Chemotaxis protein methyltransferase n=1 Tax=uncultured Pleomorphomonas sp. TaxID=442121 RepID=A0A212LIE1_9HYPH|nr:CheR family methyltransferase [uncultured Pleomorphomonas sp.]SCM77139.1 Chemotaxis protein methyltransferase [uncultured Pleomorphomonas sp.]
MSSVQATQSDRSVDQLSAKNFRRLSAFVSSYSGIKMPPGKQTMLEGRLRRRLRATGFQSLDAYCTYLFEKGGIETEAVALIDAVTTNKTDFFREPKHFEYLKHSALPALVRSGRTSLRLWSAACSVGAEPYTMAMVLADFAERCRPLDYFILATDLSTDALAAARKGIYHAGMLAPVPDDYMQRFVRRSSDPKSDLLRISPALRSKVGFARMNFMDDAYPVGEPMDVIFCRNVLIYFDKAAQAKVLGRLCDCLAPGGYLFIGHSESITGFNLPVRTVANTIFQKV